ncbi:MAG: hypothetical protein JW909_12505 [Planctomycetes bacterium]|nr:hypothetical protein [Planctomycetota bacterium]
MTAETRKDNDRQRRRFILMIVLVVAGIYALWGISELVNRSPANSSPVNSSPVNRPPNSRKDPEIAPRNVLGRIEYEIGRAEKSLENGAPERAARYAERAGNDLKLLENETLVPAERYLMNEMERKLAALKKLLEKATGGNGSDGPDIQ